MTTIVRKGDASDVDWIVSQLLEFSKLQGTHLSLFSTPEFASKYVEKIIQNQFIRVACACEGGIVYRAGFITGMLVPHPFNPGIRTFAEQFWWVAPEFRKSKAGLMLLDKFMEYGELNADWVMFDTMCNSPVNDEIFLKRGFKKQFQTFLREVA